MKLLKIIIGIIIAALFFIAIMASFSHAQYAPVELYPMAIDKVAYFKWDSHCVTCTYFLEIEKDYTICQLWRKPLKITDILEEKYEFGIMELCNFLNGNEGAARVGYEQYPGLISDILHIKCSEAVLGK